MGGGEAGRGVVLGVVVGGVGFFGRFWRRGGGIRVVAATFRIGPRVLSRAGGGRGQAEGHWGPRRVQLEL